MPEHLRAFVVICLLMLVAYAISRRMFAHALESKFVERLYGAGFGATAIMFLAHNMWVFLGGLTLLSVLVARRLRHPVALFMFLLLLMPGFSVQVPGFGLINYLIDLNPWRILSLTLLLPAAVHLAGHSGIPRPGKLFADKIVIASVAYTTLLAFLHYDTLTGGMRHLVVSTLDTILIYFVASRALLFKGAIRHFVVALVMAAIFLALVGAFEFVKHWLLYSGLTQVLNANVGMFGYLSRGDTLRALATTGQPIVLGFVMMVALLMTWYVQRLVKESAWRVLLWLIMGMGIVAAMSRGPWVGAAIGLTVIALVGPNPLGNFVRLVAAGLGAVFVLLMSPGGGRIIDYLPWMGSIDSGNIDFREILWEKSINVIARNPWIGSIDFTEAVDYNIIRTGRGFVDIVNTYLGVVLAHGLIGLGLYVAQILVGLFASGKFALIRKAHSEAAVYGVTLFGAFSAVVVTIWTVSSIGQIAPITRLLLGACVAMALQRMPPPSLTKCGESLGSSQVPRNPACAPRLSTHSSRSSPSGNSPRRVVAASPKAHIGS